MPFPIITISVSKANYNMTRYRAYIIMPNRADKLYFLKITAHTRLGAIIKACKLCKKNGWVYLNTFNLKKVNW